MSGTVITVEGVFEQDHPAERGSVSLAIGADGPEREAVLERVREAQAGLAAELRTMHAPTTGPVTRWTAERVRVWSERPWSQDGAQLAPVQHVSVTMEAEFAELDRLVDWVQSVAERDGVTVVDVRWSLTAATAARLVAEARDRAVRDAVRKATADAASLGLHTVRPVALADPGLLGDAPRSAEPVYAVPTARMSVSATPSPSLDLRPAEITVTARVHGRFLAE